MKLADMREKIQKIDSLKMACDGLSKDTDEIIKRIDEDMREKYGCALTGEAFDLIQQAFDAQRRGLRDDYIGECLLLRLEPEELPE